MLQWYECKSDAATRVHFKQDVVQPRALSVVSWLTLLSCNVSQTQIELATAVASHT